VPLVQRDLEILLADRDLLFPGELAGNPCLRQLLSQVAIDRDIQLEFSRKVSAGRVSECRPSLGYVERVPQHLRRCIERLRLYGDGFDISPVLAFFDHISPDRADLVIHGVELQGPTEEGTRIKLHVRFDSSPEVHQAMMAHSGRHPDLDRFASPLIAHTVGFDLFPGGRTRMRNYVSVPSPRLAHALFARCLDADLAEVMIEADTVWITWKDEGAEPFVYLVDADATRFIDLMGVVGVNPDHLAHRGRPPYIFGMPLAGWKARSASDYNAYYMLC
jgi:hypothetical protein